MDAIAGPVLGRSMGHGVIEDLLEGYPAGSEGVRDPARSCAVVVEILKLS